LHSWHEIASRRATAGQHAHSSADTKINHKEIENEKAEVILSSSLLSCYASMALHAAGPVKRTRTPNRQHSTRHVPAAILRIDPAEPIRDHMTAFRRSENSGG
jgi:hypothetical protein